VNATEAAEKMGGYFWDDVQTAAATFTVGEQDDGERLVYGGTPVALGDAMDSAARIAGLPSKVLGVFPPSIQVEMMNYLYSDLSSPPKAIVRSGEITYFTATKASLCNPSDVINILQKTVGGTCDFERVYASGEVVDLYCIGQKQEAVARGDLVSHGVWVSFAPFGGLSPDVAGYVNRLVCTNGMIATENLFRYRKPAGVEGNQYEWLSEYIPMAYTSCDREVERLRELIGIELNGNREAAIANVLASVPGGLHDYIRNRIIEVNPRTMYDLICVVTEIASHRLDNPRHIRSLMMAAGRLSSETSSCPVCHRAFGNGNGHSHESESG